MLRVHHVRGADRGLIALSTLCLAGPLLMAGCSDFKKSVGLEPTLPDEFAILPRTRRVMSARARPTF